MIMKGTNKFERPVLVYAIILVAAAVSALGSDSPTLTLACGIVVALTVGLLWRLGEPPALLMAVWLQLSQIVTPLLYAKFLGVPLQRVSLNIGDLSSAIWFALAAMVSLLVGIWCGQWGARAHAAPLLQRKQGFGPPELHLCSVSQPYCLQPGLIHSAQFWGA